MRRAHVQYIPACGQKYTGSSRRRGAAVAQVAVSLTVLVGFGALAIDGGRLYIARTQLQSTADSAALAAASAMLTLEHQRGENNYMLADGYSRARQVANAFEIVGSPYVLPVSNVQFGRLSDGTNLNETINLATTDYNAVRVVARRTSTSAEGPIDLTFGAIFGRDTSNVGATAVAMLDDHFSGYKPEAGVGHGPLTPLTVEKDIYADEVVNGEDRFSIDPITGEVTPVPDGVPELKLFPYKLSASDKLEDGDTLDGNGNFGILNIGVNNQGEPPVARQINDGVSQQDLMNEIGTPEVHFFDDAGNPQTIVITGNPGIKASLKEPLEQRIPTIIGFFLHRNPVVMSGQNAEYNIVSIRFGRVMYVDVLGKEKEVIVQPVYYEGPEILTDPGAGSTSLYVSRLKLVR